MPPAYYDTLIEWELMDEIFELIEEEAHAEAYRVVSQILDYVVLDTVLTHLDQSHHNDFIELCTHQHHEPSLLNWLESRDEKILESIRSSLAESKLTVKNTLLEL